MGDDKASLSDLALKCGAWYTWVGSALWIWNAGHTSDQRKPFVSSKPRHTPSLHCGQLF